MGESEETDVTRCYRHSDRRSGVICQRCDRPICTDCMTQASVGFHCPECLQKGRQTVVRGVGSGFEPRVTYVLIALNVLGFVVSTAMGGSFSAARGDALAEGGLFSALTVFRDGVPEAAGVDNGEYYRLVTSAFLHSGLFHIAFNMYALWILGPHLERILGRVRFVGLYVGSLLGAHSASC